MVLSVLTIWSARSSTTNLKSTQSEKGRDEPTKVSIKPANGDVDNGGAKDNVDATGVSAPIGVHSVGGPAAVPEAKTKATEPSPTVGDPSVKPAELKERPARVEQRFSFRSFRFVLGSGAAISHERNAVERKKAKTTAKQQKLSVFSRPADKRARKDALAVQRLIVGSGGISPANTKARAAPVSRTQMARIRSELMKPKTANKLILKLRALPEPEEPSDAAPAPTGSKPIHAVCLENTEADVQTKHFSKLKEQSIISAGVDALTSLFSELHIIDLLSAPDLGLGQPGDGKGLLAGAVPTAETVLEGAAKLTPQLMALGYATGKAILPDHSAIYPPADRMSVLTYWWGLELCLPPPTLSHLSQAPNIAHQVINFLSAMSLMYNGVREVLPFVRYIGQFVDFQWAAIERQDKGKGVVCAATWIMPAAMVPRPWDFPDSPTRGGNPTSDQPTITIPPSIPNVPLPTLVVTPPSVITNSSPKETPES